MPLKILFKIWSYLNSNRDPLEIAAAVSFAVWLAFIPSGNLLWLTIFFISLFLRINTAAELALLALLKTFIPLLYPAVSSLGELVLTWSPLERLFTTLYNLPMVPYTNFNNTVVAGGFLLGLVFFYPVYFLTRRLIIKYRSAVTDGIMGSRFYRSLLRLPVISKFNTLWNKFSNQ